MTHEEYIEGEVYKLKSCAETIIKNARSIVGDEEFQRELTVTIYLRPGDVPTINIDRDVLPERYIKELRAKNDKPKS